MFTKLKFKDNTDEQELTTEIHKDSVIKVISPLRHDVQSMKLVTCIYLRDTF